MHLAPRRLDRQLGAGEHPEPDQLGRGRSLVESSDGVVVGERDDEEAGGGRLADDLRGFTGTVGSRRMQMEIGNELGQR
jgi:hypothetical protein